MGRSLLLLVVVAGCATDEDAHSPEWNGLRKTLGPATVCGDSEGVPRLVSFSVDPAQPDVLLATVEWWKLPCRLLWTVDGTTATLRGEQSCDVAIAPYGPRPLVYQSGRLRLEEQGVFWLTTGTGSSLEGGRSPDCPRVESFQLCRAITTNPNGTVLDGDCIRE